MLTINLLTLQAKKIIVYERYRRAVIAAGIMLSLVLMVFAMLLLPTFFFIVFRGQEVQRALGSELDSTRSDRLDALESVIGEINGLAKKILDSDSSSRRIFPLVEEILGDIPEDINLNSLRFAAESKTMVLDGHAQSRQALLTTIEGLRGNSVIAGVTSPVANIIRERDFDFTLNITLK